MRKKAYVLTVFLLGVLVGSLVIVPSIGDTTWVMGDLKPIADRLHVGERFEGYHVSDILNAMTDRLMLCCPNVPPQPADDEYETVPGATSYFDVLTNDTDLDSDALSLTAVLPAAFGRTSLSHNMVQHTADGDWCGQELFNYEVSDGQGHFSEATVTVSVEWGLMITEVELNPAGSDAGSEWVEIYNASNEPVSLDGWEVSISTGCTTGENRCWQSLPSDVTVDPWDHYVFVTSAEVFDDTRGWRVSLRDPGGAIPSQTAAGLDDTADNYLTWQRIPDGSLLDSSWTYDSSTRDAYNYQP